MPSNASKTDKSIIRERDEQAVRNNIETILGDLIKINGINADILSKETGIGKGTISHYLNSKTSPKALELRKLADYFGVTCDDLIRGVRAGNVDIQKRTGLSDLGIQHLCDFKDKKSHLDILDKLLKTNLLRDWIHDIDLLGVDAINAAILRKDDKIYDEVNSAEFKNEESRIQGRKVELTKNQVYDHFSKRLKDFFIIGIEKKIIEKNRLENMGLDELREKQKEAGEIWRTEHYLCDKNSTVKAKVKQENDVPEKNKALLEKLKAESRQKEREWRLKHGEHPED